MQERCRKGEKFKTVKSQLGMAESKEEPVSNGLMWDASVSASYIEYSKGMRRATVKTGEKQRIVRGPFWDSDRHIVNIKVNNVIPDKTGLSIGIIDRGFDVYGNYYVGKTANSYSYNVAGPTYNNGSKKGTFKGYNIGDIITIEINLDTKTVIFSLNGMFVCKFTDVPNEIAVAANLYYKDYSIEILQYYKMWSNVSKDTKMTFLKIRTSSGS